MGCECEKTGASQEISQNGSSSLDPMIIQSCWRQREAVWWLCKDQRGAGMHLQCNCRHWVVIIINNNLQTIYMSFSLFTAPPNLRMLLPCQPLVAPSGFSMYTQQRRPAMSVYTVQRKLWWDTCQRGLTNSNWTDSPSPTGRKPSKCKQASVRDQRYAERSGSSQAYATWRDDGNKKKKGERRYNRHRWHATKHLTWTVDRFFFITDQPSAGSEGLTPETLTGYHQHVEEQSFSLAKRPDPEFLFDGQSSRRLW